VNLVRPVPCERLVRLDRVELDAERFGLAGEVERIVGRLPVEPFVFQRLEGDRPSRSKSIRAPFAGCDGGPVTVLEAVDRRTPSAPTGVVVSCRARRVVSGGGQ
jgi:hypothetical protein